MNRSNEFTYNLKGLSLTQLSSQTLSCPSPSALLHSASSPLPQHLRGRRRRWWRRSLLICQIKDSRQEPGVNLRLAGN